MNLDKCLRCKSLWLSSKYISESGDQSYGFTCDNCNFNYYSLDEKFATANVHPYFVEWDLNRNSCLIIDMADKKCQEFRVNAVVPFDISTERLKKLIVFS